MQNKKSIVASAIYKTDDYSLFNIQNGNRDIVPSKVEMLKQAISKRDLTRDNPILVDEDMNILDGQHRKTACESLGLPIFYTVSETTTIDDVAILNDNRTSWKIDDYVKSYAVRGHKEYIRLLDCIDKFDGKITMTGMLRVMGYHSRGQQTPRAENSKSIANVRAGKFSYPQGSEHLMDISRMIDIAECFDKKTISQNILMAYMSHIKPTEDYDHSQLLKNLNRRNVKWLASGKDFAKELNEAYNYGLKKTSRVQFKGLDI